MKRIIIGLAALSVLMPAAGHAQTNSFVRDEAAYSYKVEVIDGTRTIVGIDHSTGRRFTLRVKGDHVAGKVGNDTVSFRIAQKTSGGRIIASN